MSLFTFLRHFSLIINTIFVSVSVKATCDVTVYTVVRVVAGYKIEEKIPHSMWGGGSKMLSILIEAIEKCGPSPRENQNKI
jgi:hypothetical protein